jgi:protein-tyrosine-phosphatase
MARQSIFISMSGTPKKVLFICKGNWFRSQIAVAIYNTLTNSDQAESAGTYVGAPDEPEGQKLSSLFASDDFFCVMEEHGMYIRNNTTKRLREEVLASYDIVVAMVEEPFIPEFLKKDKTIIWWEVENPEFVDRKVSEDTYQKIYLLVTNLINSS